MKGKFHRDKKQRRLGSKRCHSTIAFMEAFYFLFIQASFNLLSFIPHFLKLTATFGEKESNSLTLFWMGR